MDRIDIAALAHALPTPTRTASASRRGAQPDTGFDTRIAAFYPYAQSPVDPQPRAGAPGDARQRAGAVGATAPAQRRQSRRDES